jgi:uncharacterized lipoprotein YddW (UPF0748 family)
MRNNVSAVRTRPCKSSGFSAILEFCGQSLALSLMREVRVCRRGFAPARSGAAMLRSLAFACFGLLVANVCPAAPAGSQSGPPRAAREFRGVWVATVENIDWPSKPGLPVEKQKHEFVAILDKCVELNINAVIFQIRTQGDALYDSKIEPWSEFLTGKMGKPPEPYYDPLKFAIEEAHKRGLQLHAWFNPYRARVPGSKGEAAPTHPSVTHANSVRKYGKYQWFDPGDPASEDEFIAVLTDVVKRYDVDGVHIDDYFYPYEEKDENNKTIPFPDDETYKKAVASGVQLDRADWRRQNVNHLVERMYEEVKKEKPWVLVGISPFGIWRPGHPKGVTGLDQYATLYADVRKWEQEGWLDYLTPQIYWQIESKGQPYAKLLGWWAEQNVKQRHLWPGNFTSKIGVKPKIEEPTKDKKGGKDKKDEEKKEKPAPPWTADDIIRQIEATRATPGATGNVQFSMKALMRNSGGIADKLKKGPYAEPALVPESPWLGHETPGKPEISAKRTDSGVAVEMRMPTGAESGDPRATTALRDPRTSKAPWLWLVRVLTNKGWKTTILPGSMNEQVVALPNDLDARAVLVSGVSRLGREGQSTRAKVAKRD